MDYQTIILGFFATIIFFAILDYITLRNMRSDHERLAKLGADLIGKYDLTLKQENFIKSCLDDIFQWWFMPFAVLMLPIIALKIFSRKRAGIPRVVHELLSYPEYHEFRSIHFKSLASSNSLFAIIFFILALSIVVPVTLLKGLKTGVKVAEAAIYRASPRFNGNNYA